MGKSKTNPGLQNDFVDFEQLFKEYKTNKIKRLHQRIECGKCKSLVSISEFNYSLKQLHVWRAKITSIPELNDFKSIWFCLECQKEIKKELKKINRNIL